MAVNELIVTPEFLSQEIPLQTELESNIMSQDVAGGGGKVQSVNGKNGEVVLTAEDIGYDDTTIADALEDLKNGKADIITDTASGAVASFPDGAPYPVKGLVIGIEPVQAGSGDPAPDNVRPISGWTGASGALTGPDLISTIEYIDGKYYNDNGSLSNSLNMKYEETYVSVVPGQTYLFICESTTDSNTVRVHEYAAARTWKRQILSETPSVGHFVIQYTASPDAYFIRFALPKLVSSITLQMGKNLSVNWQSAAGTVYGGTLDVLTGVLTVTKWMISFGPGEYGGLKLYTTNLRAAFRRPLPYDSTGTISGNLCSAVKINSSSSATEDYADKITCRPGSGNASNMWYIFMPLAIASTLQELEDWIDDNPFDYVFVLKTPQTYQLTSQQVFTLLGENNVWFDCGPTSVEYSADTKLYIQKVINAAIAAL